MSKRSAFLAATAFSVLLCLATGCGSPGYKRAEGRVESIQTVERNLTDVKKQVEVINTDLQAISTSAGADPRKAYDKFVADVGTLKSQREKVRSNVEDMNARGKEYFEAWRKDLQQISDPDIRAKAEEREAKAKERFNRIRTAGEQARDAYDPYAQTLDDIQKYLANSLNAEGIRTIQPNIDKARSSGATLTQKIDVMVAEIGTTAKAISPTSGAPGGAPAGGTAPAPETSTKPN
jgi:chromosome segregation ATPase